MPVLFAIMIAIVMLPVNDVKIAKHVEWRVVNQAHGVWHFFTLDISRTTFRVHISLLVDKISFFFVKDDFIKVHLQFRMKI